MLDIGREGSHGEGLSRWRWCEGWRDEGDRRKVGSVGKDIE